MINNKNIEFYTKLKEHNLPALDNLIITLIHTFETTNYKETEYYKKYQNIIKKQNS